MVETTLKIGSLEAAGDKAALGKHGQGRREA
jgi:hypothetical protein